MNGEHFIRTLAGHSNSVTSLQLLSNNKLASGSYDHSIKIWNVDSGQCIPNISLIVMNFYSFFIINLFIV